MIQYNATAVLDTLMYGAKLVMLNAQPVQINQSNVMVGM
jgi:hypothetical protein